MLNSVLALRQFLSQHPPAADSAAVQALFLQLIQAGMADLPAPGAGHTLLRWQLLAEVAAHDLSLVKLFEGHADALAVLQEVADGDFAVPAHSAWGLWAAESPGARVTFTRLPDTNGAVLLQGKKAWCSGAHSATHGLLTVWPDGVLPANAAHAGPFLAAVDMQQPGLHIGEIGSTWPAVGMAHCVSVDVQFDGAAAQLIGPAGAYLHRPGFWQGGAGIAACWHGGAAMLGRTLHQALSSTPAAVAQEQPFRAAALGKVDVALQANATLLRQAAAWIDANPLLNASAWAWRTRLAAEATASTVLAEVGKTLGAAPFCKNAHFARMAADLPVYVRQSHAERDFAALGWKISGSASALETPPWAL